MMHGRGKSDSAIVAVKPTNEAERSAAEPVEPRAEAKGNAGQQSTCRAQHRISVSQALERIRKVARERKTERFTSLLHHISIDLLEEAFFELEEDAAPGVDGPALAACVEQAIRAELLFRPEVRAVPPGSLPRAEMKARRWRRKTAPGAAEERPRP